MKKILEKLKNRYNILSISIVFVGLIFSYQLYNLQIVKGKEFDGRNINERRVKAPRGAIKDRNGIPIAINRTSYIIQIYKTKIKEAQLNDMIFRLVNILERNEKDKSPYISDFGKYLTPKPFAFESMLNTKENLDRAKLDKWKKDIGIKKSDMAIYDTPDKIFNFLRKYYNIQDTYSDEDAYKIISIRYELIMKGYSSLTPLVIAKDVSQNTVAEIDERHDELPGVTVNTQPVRKYVNADMESQIIGYVGSIEPKELKKLEEDGYQRNDVIGKSGMEYQAESYLRGRDGAKTIEEDAMGKQTGELGGNEAIPGNDVYLTLDSKLQRVAMESLKNNIEAIRQKNERNNFQDAFAGAAVALDVNTGEVLAMASYPGYDPSVFLEPSGNKSAQDQIGTWLTDNKNIPMYNRAIQGIYTPGSTFKPITAIASLETGVNAPDMVVYDDGKYTIDNMTFYCLEYREGFGAHGDLTLERALATSCNVYFHKIGVATGIDNIDKWAKIFGLGEKTGIDLPGERLGNRANRAYKNKYYKTGWWAADTAQAAIGQSFQQYTPIQLANYVATIANGGRKFKPHLIKEVKKYDGSLVTETEPEFEKLDVKPEYLDAVKKGMVAVANATDGTAVDTFSNFPYKVAGKTGTPETGAEKLNHSSNGLFVCYAPADAPKIAVAVVIERGAWGSNAAPIAKDIMAQYFNLNNTSGNDDRIRTGDVVFTP